MWLPALDGMREAAERMGLCEAALAILGVDQVGELVGAADPECVVEPPQPNAITPTSSRPVLLSAATAAGKTEAAFLPILSRLAQDAGVALEEIEGVSKTLAALIQSISNAAQQQTSSAGQISLTMNVIQQITSQTSSGSTATAESIGNLAQLSADLRRSVADFKLPA